MVVPVNDTANDDDATRLVLDIVQKVLEPATVKDASQRINCRSHQNYYINANINCMNASININYKRWSTNDGNEQHPVTNSGHNAIDSNNNNINTQEEILLRASKTNRYHKMNFWDQYSGENTIPNPMLHSNQRGMLPIQQQQHFFNQNILNTRYIGKNSWRDNPVLNPVFSNKCFNQLQQHPNQYQQQIIPENNFQYRKNIRKCCSFCRKNGESYEFYTTHSLYENGKPSCPILRKCVCNICGQSGHTMSHCNLNTSKNSILKMIHRFNMMK